MTTSNLLSELAGLGSRDLDRAIARVHSLGDSKDKAVVPVLMKLLKGPYHADLKNAAAVALRDLAADQAVPALLTLVKDPANRHNRGTFVYALETLDWFSHAKHVQAVVDLLSDKNTEVREEAKAVIKSALARATQAQKLRILTCVLDAQLAHVSAPEVFSGLTEHHDLAGSTA